MSNIIRLLKLKDYITLSGTICGIFALMVGILLNDLSLAFFFIMICQGTDLLDGYVARKLNQVNKIGKEMDSLNDLFCFGVVPAMLIFIGYCNDLPFELIFYIPAVIIFILGALLRLARFNIMDAKGYTGIVTPFSGLIVTVFYYIDYFSIQTFYQNNFISIWVQLLFPFLLGFLGYLNITTFIIYGEELKKKSGNLKYVFISGGILTIVIGIIGLTFPKQFAALPILCLFIVSFVMGWFYIFIGFKNYLNSRKNLKEELNSTS